MTLIENDTDKILDNLLLNTNRLVVYNDSQNSFEWVILCFCTYLGHTHEQAEQCAYIIHTKGKYSVKEGSYEELKPYKDILNENGLNSIIE